MSGEGITRRRYGSGHPRSSSRARALYPPRWTLRENPSSQPGRDLASKYKTAQNFRNWWLRISGTHTRVFDAAERVALTPRTETVGVQHHRLDLSGLSVCAVSSRKKPTGKWFRNQAEAAIPQSYSLSRRVQ